MTLAYWSILATAFLPIGCAAYAKRLASFSWADNHDPRAFLARTRGKAARANAAQQNSYEIFPPFAAAVIIAHATGNAAQATINLWALLFVASRLAFFIAISATARRGARRCLASTCSASSRCLSRRRRACACHFECRRYADCLLLPPRVPLKKAFAFFKG